MTLAGGRVKRFLIISLTLMLIIGFSGALAVYLWPGFFARTALNFYLKTDKADPEMTNFDLMTLPPEKYWLAAGTQVNPPPPAGATVATPTAPGGTGTPRPDSPWPGNHGASPQPDPHSRYTQIVGSYRDDFNAMKNTYDGKLNHLISEAVKEYHANKNNKDFSAKATAEKYIARGRALENECDGKFYAKLAALESELKAESLPTWVVEQADKAYQAQKEAQRKQILRKAAEGSGI